MLPIPSYSSPDAERVAALRAYDILDTPEEEVFDQLTQAAAQVCGMPMSLLSLVDTDRQWFKSRHGFTLTETGRDLSFCAYAIQQHQTFTVEDALADERFRTNRLVTGEPNLRSYAGKPLITPEGQALGTLCVLDTVPRTLSTDQQLALERLAESATRLLAMRKRYKGAVFAKAVDTAQDGIAIADAGLPGCPLIFVNQSFMRLTGVAYHEAVGQSFCFPLRPDSDGEAIKQLEKARSQGETTSVDVKLVRGAGEACWDRVMLVPYVDEACRPVYLVVVHRDLTLEKERETQRQKLEAMQTTMKTVNHVVRNFMNAVQLYRTQLHTGEPVDPRLLSLLDNALQETRQKLAAVDRMPAFKERSTPFGFTMLDPEE